MPSSRWRCGEHEDLLLRDILFFRDQSEAKTLTGAGHQNCPENAQHAFELARAKQAALSEAAKLASQAAGVERSATDASPSTIGSATACSALLISSL